MRARYALLKFVPDAIRFEPVNIGLVVEADDRVITRMAESLDPRIRLADPYVDTRSLKDFLSSFSAALPSSDRHPIDWLREHGMPNIFVSAPLEIESDPAKLDALVDSLYRRLVARTYTRPPDLVRMPGTSAARTALREAFRTVGVLGARVETDVSIAGASGLEWRIDFRFMTNRAVTLVEAATTGLQEDVRGKEHAFEAFSTLIDVMRRDVRPKEPQPNRLRGVLAVDAKPEDNEISRVLERMAAAHDLQYVAGQRGFYELAERVRQDAIPLSTGERDPSDNRWIN